MIKHFEKNNLKQEGFILAHSSKLQLILEAYHSRWELQGAGHIASRISNKECLCSVFLPYFYIVQDPAPGNDATHSG